MKIYLLAFLLQFCPLIGSAQFTLSTLKSYIVLSPSKLDEALTRKGFIFDTSKQNEDNDGKEYSWNSNNRAMPATINWIWIKEDTVPLFREGTNEHLGYCDEAIRGILYNSPSPDLYNDALKALSTNKAFKREENSNIGLISVGFESTNWWITLNKSRDELTKQMVYSIMIKERHSVMYQIHYLNKSIQREKSVNLGE